jgi:flagellin
MSLNSINTNLAAYSAQSNIGSATSSATASIARLSSGDRIVRAADDVASLSVGTSLRTGVTTLRQALNNTSQGSSLLQVADGALAQIGEILQRQKAISVQANSGTLSDLERSYLQQEFSALASQIDQIAGATSFSSVSLLDGSLAGSATMGSKTFDGTSTAGATAAALITFANAVPANGDEITINGVTISFTTDAVGEASAVGKVTIGADVTGTANNLVNFLNSSTDARLSNLYFTNAAGAVSANWGGGLLTGAYVVDATLVTGTAANLAVGTAANRTIAVTNPTEGLGVDRVRAIGATTGTILVNGGATAATTGSAINTRTIEDNVNFIGQLGEGALGLIEGSVTATDTATFSLKVGNITYTTAATDIVDAAPVVLTFTGRDESFAAAGGTFTISIRGGAVTTFTSQTELDSVVSQVNDALSSVRFTQNRDIATFQEGGTALVGGSEVGNLNGISANYRTDDFSSVQIESIQITAPSGGSTDATFTAIINGETYVSAPGIGNQIDINTAVHMQSLTDPTKSFSLVMGSSAIAGSTTTALDLGSQEKANAVAAALETAFGLDEAGSKLNFQVGIASNDTVGVKIQEVSSDQLYGGATLDVTTLGGAVAAGAVLDSAITSINTIRAQVGALQSRLDFIAANLESSIQNQDAARGTLLDADIAAESTAYATAQVQLQAGISVLAQANQLPQNLLKLIG